MEIPDFEPRKVRVPRTRNGEDGPAQAGGAAQQLAATIGNGGIGRVLASPGEQRAEGSRATLDESVARAIEQRRGAGAPLPPHVREEMEPAFGRDFSDVRVHAGSEAHELNESVQARAFTVGSDIFFKHGTYDTTSSGGKKLLAHELTHVVQQSGAGGGTPTTVTDPHDASERQADAVAQAVTASAGEGPPATPAVARSEEEIRIGRQEDEEELQLARQTEDDEQEA